MSDIIARPRLLSVIVSHCAPAPTEQAVRCDHVETNVFASAPSKSKRSDGSLASLDDPRLRTKSVREG